jgi:PAS domain S-box-containing protein
MNTSAKIIIVEDEGIVALDLQQQLLDLGYSVSAIISAGEVVVQKVQEDPPDLILMDIQLRDEMDGITAMKEIQKNMRIPVVYLTAYADDEILERARETEPYGYLVKPFNAETLRTTVEMALFKFQSERKLYDYTYELEQKNMLLQLLNRLVKTAVQVPNRHNLLQMACSGLADTLHLPYAFAISIGQSNKSDNILFERVNGGPTISSTRLSNEANRICQKSFMRDKPWVIQNTNNDPCLEILSQYKSMALPYQLFILPLVVVDEVIGIIGLGAKHIEDISVSDIRVAWNVVTEIVVALETVSATGTHQKFSDVLFHSNISIAVTDQTGALEYINPAFEKISGYLLQDLVGHPITSLLAPDDDNHTSVNQALNKAIQQGSSWYGSIELTTKRHQSTSSQAALWPIYKSTSAAKEEVKSVNHQDIPLVTNFVCFIQANVLPIKREDDV